MRIKGRIAVLACSMMLVGGCGEQKAQEELVVPVAEEEPMEDTAMKLESVTVNETTYTMR